ncbi:disease resistance protein RUN1-like isoform X2 [Cornus florida]|uniref:disease resistance protein RUN1-like isoform X2 n=1 Tax=Cornus florida TaxID=4283 RepID=UPI002898662F|nr:disease resistance protein RUN1-like isoform X2 [Cornus florida]
MDSETSTSTAFNPSSTTLVGGEYDVFLSFRGPDTRKTFTDYLYTSLEGAGVRTFRDNNGLREGKEIGPELHQAITQSKISIPIFSKGYASSKWCLHELVRMVECKRTTRQLILPIFYDVEPFEVRHQSGSYEEAFRKHESCFLESTVKEWKESLTEVGALKGWVVEKEADGHLGELVMMVVRTVLLELKKKCMDLTDSLVGINDNVDKMMRLLKVGSNDTQIVGMYGMGGIGKTTIAKWIYNKLFQCFECCSFLTDIREKAQQYMGLVSLQKQLLKDALNLRGDNISDVNSGINEIKQRFLRHKVLIVLDDLNEKSHFDCLVGKRDWYGKGSRIIVTTRNKHVLNAIQVDEVYEPQFLNLEQSLQLLSIHAFKRESPPEDLDNISREVASTAAGLPLTLEVLGSYLFDKPKKVWEATLKKLEKIPDDEVQKKLRISYDELTHEQKQIFLDIACVFRGMKITFASYMWESCGYYPEKNLYDLRLMSLVKMEADNVLRMHDQLRGLGREIVRQENLRNQGAHSRLWDQKEAGDVLKERRGTEKIEVLSLDYLTEELTVDEIIDDFIPTIPYTGKVWRELVNNYDDDFMPRPIPELRELVREFGELREPAKRYLHASHDDDFLPPTIPYTSKEFRELVNIRYLHMNGVKLVGDFKHLMSQLRWLRWYRCPSHFKATNFHMNNLVILDLANSPITENWEGWSQIKVANKLKVLNLTNCDLRRTPEFSSFASLEILILECCSKLAEIDPSIGNLDNLRELNISQTKIKKLPDAIWILEKLEVIDASYCLDLKCNIPSCIGRSSSFRHLRFRYTKIQSLPTSICDLLYLQTLDLDYCEKLEVVPDLPSSLKILKVKSHASQDRDLRVTPNNVANLVNLQNLEFDGLREDVEFPRDIEKLSKLQALELSNSNIRILPKGIGALSQLKILGIRTCHDLQCILGLPFTLVELSLENCELLERLTDLSNLKNLLILSFVSCHKLMKIQGLGELESLKTLYVYGCHALREVQLFGKLKSLQRLTIGECHTLTVIQGLGNLESLTSLDIRKCNEITELDLLECSTSLPSSSSLEMSHTLKEVQLFGKLKSLERLRIGECHTLRVIQGLGNLESLTYLKIHECNEITELDLLECSASLPSSSSLEMSHTLKEVQLFGKLKSLKRLTIRECHTLRVIRGLGNLESLTFLEIDECNEITELDLLECSASLPSSSSLELRVIQGLGNLESLTSLEIDECNEITEQVFFECSASLPSSSSLEMSEYKHLENQSIGSNLKKLLVRSCKNLTKIQGLDRLVSVEDLNLYGCKSIVRLPNLSNLKMLRHLTLEKCTSLCEIEGVEALEALEVLDVRECTSLEQIPDLPNTHIIPINPITQEEKEGSCWTSCVMCLLCPCCLLCVLCCLIRDLRSEQPSTNWRRECDSDDLGIEGRDEKEATTEEF